MILKNASDSDYCGPTQKTNINLKNFLESFSWNYHTQLTYPLSRMNLHWAVQCHKHISARGESCKILPVVWVWVVPVALTALAIARDWREMSVIFCIFIFLTGHSVYRVSAIPSVSFRSTSFTICRHGPMLVWKMTTPGHGDSDCFRISTSTRLPDACITRPSTDLTTVIHMQSSSLVTYLVLTFIIILCTHVINPPHTTGAPSTLTPLTSATAKGKSAGLE